MTLALLFGARAPGVTGGQFATEFYAGWLTEYSLSVDNLFVFVIIMARFQVPRKLQQEALMVGIIIALVLRGIFILLGAAVIERFTWVFYIFGAFLVYTAINLVRHRGRGGGLRGERVHPADAEGPADDARTSTAARSGSREDGKKFWTPMIIVFLALGTTDLLFALDSIPAIFGLTQEPFIVFTANVFALMGLRQLYFLLGGLLKRLVYLSLGLAVILALHRREAGPGGAAQNALPFINGGEHIECGAGDPDLAVADGHPGRAGHRHRREPGQDPAASSATDDDAGRRAAEPVRRASRCRGAVAEPRGMQPAEDGRAPARLASPVMRPDDLALLRTPGVPHRLARTAAMAVVAVDPARPRGRRVPRPAVGGAHRRVGAGAAADQRRTGTARPRSPRTAAGWRSCAPSRRASRRSS